MRVLPVNVGRARANRWKPVTLTGITKCPVDGPVMVTRPGPKGTGAVGLTTESGLLPRLLAADAMPDGIKELARVRT
jgi:MOSC domain-containing protein YiiM